MVLAEALRHLGEAESHGGSDGCHGEGWCGVPWGAMEGVGVGCHGRSDGMPWSPTSATGSSEPGCSRVYLSSSEGTVILW